MKYIYTTIGIFIWAFINQAHAATPTVITGEQACKMKSGTHAILNSTKYTIGAKPRSTVSGESVINTDTTQWKTDAYKYGTSLYYIQITATGGQYKGMTTEDMYTSGFGHHVSDISVFRYDCIKKTNTQISKENLKKESRINYSYIRWARGGIVSVITGWDGSDMVRSIIFSERTGKIYNFSTYTGYLQESEFENIQYYAPGKVLITQSFRGENIPDKKYIVDLYKKTASRYYGIK